MNSIESQIEKRLQVSDADMAGAQDLIDAHLDEVSGGAFSMHIQFGSKSPTKVE
jgi:hypothetical protein